MFLYGCQTLLAMLILAPMQGLTEVLFRRVVSRCFPQVFDYAISPFISLTHGNLHDALKKIDDVLPENNEGCMPVVPQILGKEIEEFVALSNRLYECGFGEVNWNIGCPMRRVAGKHRGSGILPYPNEVLAVLDNVVPRMKPRLSVKMRLGYVHDDEIFKIIPVLNDYPLVNVTIHPRTGKQQYGGIVNLDRFGEVLPLIKHKVIYNGDIKTLADYERIHTRFPQVEDFMIGRGALQNPLLPATIKGHQVGVAECRHFIIELMEEVLRQSISQEAKVRKMKEYWCLVWHALPIGEQQARAVLRTADLAEVYASIISIVK